MMETDDKAEVTLDVLLGKNVLVGKYVVLGVMPTKKKPVRKLQIGDNSIIRSHTVIYAGNKIGKNFQTGHGVMIRENNEIGDNVSIGTNSTIERDNKIGNGVRIHSNCFVPEFIEIRDKAWLGPGVTILNVLHPPCPKFEECAKGMIIGENAKIGGNVTLGPRIKIGKNSGCDIVVSGLGIGKTAATISRRPDGYYLSYVGGLSKLRVNGEVIKESIKLKVFDVVELGSAKMQFFTKEE